MFLFTVDFSARWHHWNVSWCFGPSNKFLSGDDGWSWPGAREERRKRVFAGKCRSLNLYWQITIFITILKNNFKLIFLSFVQCISIKFILYNIQVNLFIFYILHILTHHIGLLIVDGCSSVWNHVTYNKWKL